MKIGILTQPLHNNYGGILQAYALQTTLKRLGHDPWIINRDFKEPSYLRIVASKIKWILYNYFINRKYSIFRPTPEEKAIISKHTSSFIKSNIQPATPKITNNKQLKKLREQGFEGFVVGSDQVWRPAYSPCITNYFFDFAEQWKGIKKVAYAASFGVDSWEFLKDQTEVCARLAKKFDAVSVREDSGIILCKEYLGVDAVHVLDPTMLLDAEDYKALVDEADEPQSPGNLMVYILDESEEKRKIVQAIADRLNLVPFFVMPEFKFSNVTRTMIDKCVYPPVTRWLKGFMDAEFVVTDSFHGTVFSIIFNKPFVVIGNEERGLSRFNSLLKLFELEDRIINDQVSFNASFLSFPADNRKLNRFIKINQLSSIGYLIASLK